MREQKREHRTLSRYALRPYLPAVSLGDLTRYREPEADAAVGTGRVRPVEALEDEGQLVLGVLRRVSVSAMRAPDRLREAGKSC